MQFVMYVTAVANMKPDRCVNTAVPELDGVVPSTGDEDVSVTGVKHARKHTIVVPIHAIKIATTINARRH